MANTIAAGIHLVKDGKAQLEASIGVNAMEFQQNITTTWRELFSGYQHLKAQTYSFGLPFIAEVIRLFDDAEIVIGCANQLRADTAELFAVQGAVTDYVCKHTYLQERIEAGTLRLYVAKDTINHGKVYLLNSDDGRCRVISGSANMSARAWDGSQIENYDCCDSPGLYNIAREEYESLRNLSTDTITKDAVPIKEDGTNIDKLPFFKEVKEAGSALVVHDVLPDEEVEFAFTQTRMSESFRDALTAARVKTDKKKGTTLFDVKKLNTMKNFAKKKGEKLQSIRQQQPALELDYENNTVILNGEVQDLHPDAADVRHDILCWQKYLNGYEEFSGDTADLKEKAWKVLNHVFASPFFAMLRYQGDKVKISGRWFPMYLLLVGPRDNGKSELMQACQRLVLGFEPLKLTPANFSGTIIKGLDENVKGCPILIDDVTPRYWANVGNIVKTDNVLIEQGFVNHPTFLLTSNGVRTVADDITKRIVMMRVNNQLSKDKAAKNESDLIILTSKMHNAFWRQYAGKMFMAVQEMIAVMLDDEHRPEGWKADIYAVSSQIIIDIMKENGFDIPDELHVFKWEEYMGEDAVAGHAEESVRALYHISPERFKVDRKNNELVIDFTGFDGSVKMMDLLMNELPSDMEKRRFGNKFSMRLDAAQEHTGVVFREKKKVFGIFGKR